MAVDGTRAEHERFAREVEVMEHRDDCTCFSLRPELVEPGTYPTCWTDDQVAEHQQRIADYVRVGMLTEPDRVASDIERIKDAIELERMRHANEADRLTALLARAEQEAARVAQSRGISDR